MVVQEDFPSQKNMDTPEPIAQPYGSYLVYSHAKHFIATLLGPVIQYALMQQYKFTATLDGNIELHHNIIDHPTFSVQFQNFF